MKQVLLSELKLLDNNPRKISDSQMELLKKSLEVDEFMMEGERIVIDENNTVLSGNQRVKAFIQMGRTSIPENWIDRFENWTEDQKKTFIIKKNHHNGTDDIEILQKHWMDVKNVDMSFADKAMNDFIEESEEDNDIPKKEDNTKGTPANWYVTINANSKEDADELVKEIKENGHICYAHN